MTDNTDDNIGRDKIVHGDVVGQDKVAGDKIVNEQNVYGDLHIHHAPVEPTTPPVDFAAIEQLYRNQIVKHYNKLALTGLPERDPGLHEIALEQIFIKLNIELPQPDGLNFIKADVKDLLALDVRELDDEYARQRHLVEMPPRRPEPITLSVAEALRRHPHLTIIGGPGSGKTTLTRWLAVIFARREQAKLENLGTALADNRLPIVLELRRFAERFATLGQHPAVPDLAGEIASFISQHAYYPETPSDFIQQALKAGRCLVLLDGLDEIADLKARQTLSDAVQAFLQHTNQGYRQNLLLVTSRPHGYHSISLSTFQECEVKPFSKEDVASFIRHWYATAYPDQEQTEADNLIDAIQANDRVGELATNPLLCTIIAIVYRNNRVLPNRRVELYLKCCEALLDTWERNKAIKQSGLIGGYDWQTKLELLAPMAYWLHSEAERLAAPEADFVTQLAGVLRARQLVNPAQAEQTARQFIEVICDRSGLLQGRGDGTLEFTHRTFQEYLAARHIAAQPYPDYIDWVLVHLHEAWWREVHLLVISYLGSSSTTADRTTALLQAILAYIPPPWPWLCSFSIRAIAPDWLLHLATRLENSTRLAKWGISTLIVTTVSPLLAWHLISNLLPKWQLARRLAWLLDREFVLAAQGYLDCMPVGLYPSLAQQLSKRAEILLTRYIYDDAYSYGTLIESHARLIRRLQISGVDIQMHIFIMLTALQQTDEFVRCSAIDAMKPLVETNSVILSSLLTSLQDSEWIVRSAAANALSQFRQTDTRVISALLAAFQDTEWIVRKAAAKTVGQLGKTNPIVVSTLIANIHAPDKFVRSATISALGQLHQLEPVVIPILLTAVQDPEWIVRDEAVSALGQLSQSALTVVPILLTTLQDPNEYVRSATVQALGQLGQPNQAVISALLISLQDSESLVRRYAARALGQLGQIEPAVIPALLVALKDPDWVVREEATNALGLLGQANPEVLPILLTAYQISDRYIRFAITNALGQLGRVSSSGLAVLRNALRDPDALIRKASVDALSRLEVDTKDFRNQLLINLNKRMHPIDNDSRREALELISRVLEGQPLTGYRWTPIRERLERRRRLNRFRWWAIVVCLIVLTALVVVYLSARLDADSLLVRFGAALALITGLVAGVAQVLGWTLRSPYEKYEP